MATNQSPTQNQNNAQESNEATAEMPGKKKVARYDLKAESRHVLDFLTRCTRYEADAVRAVATSVDTSGKVIKQLSADDTNAVSYFLSHSPNKPITTMEELQVHRNAQMKKLLKSLKQFCTLDSYDTMMEIVSDIATDPKLTKSAFDWISKK